MAAGRPGWGCQRPSLVPYWAHRSHFMKPEPVPRLGQGAGELVTLHYLGASIGRPPCPSSAHHRAMAAPLGTEPAPLCHSLSGARRPSVSTPAGGTCPCPPLPRESQAQPPGLLLLRNPATSSKPGAGTCRPGSLGRAPSQPHILI